MTNSLLNQRNYNNIGKLLGHFDYGSAYWFLERKSRKVQSFEVHRTRKTKFDDWKDLGLEIILDVTFFMLFGNSYKFSWIVSKMFGISIPKSSYPFFWW